MKNKRAVRNLKSQDKHPKEVYPPVKRPTWHKQPARGQADGVNSTTVVVSKSYLDQLLKASLGGDKKQPVVLQPQNVNKSSEEKPPSPVPATSVSTSQTSSVLPRATIPSSSSSHAIANDDSYFPFGRPGCGAPLRSDSGQVVADLRQRARAKSYGKSVPEPSHARSKVCHVGQEVDTSGKANSSRYARGAGPHVCDYVLREKEDRRKKELEHAVSVINDK